VRRVKVASATDTLLLTLRCLDPELFLLLRCSDSKGDVTITCLEILCSP
jgi:hypothetical protein